MKIEIVPIPTKRGKYQEIKQALLTLKDGESLKVDRDTFKGGLAGAALQMGRSGRVLHTRKLLDGLYLWLDPLPTNGEAKDPGGAA